jgi:hypothetical protein
VVTLASRLPNALPKTGKHNVTALARVGTSEIIACVKLVEIDYDREESTVAVLRGQQFLVISFGVFCTRESPWQGCQGAAKAGVAYIMPNVTALAPKAMESLIPVLLFDKQGTVQD